MLGVCPSHARLYGSADTGLVKPTWIGYLKYADERLIGASNDGRSDLNVLGTIARTQSLGMSRGSTPICRFGRASAGKHAERVWIFTMLTQPQRQLQS